MGERRGARNTRNTHHSQAFAGPPIYKDQNQNTKSNISQNQSTFNNNSSSNQNAIMNTNYNSNFNIPSKNTSSQMLKKPQLFVNDTEEHNYQQREN